MFSFGCSHPMLLPGEPVLLLEVVDERYVFLLRIDRLHALVNNLLPGIALRLLLHGTIRVSTGTTSAMHGRI